MSFKRMFVVTLFALSTLFVMPIAVEAKTARVAWNGRVIEVVSNLPLSWQTKNAV
jgi:hypothetical protein